MEVSAENITLGELKKFCQKRKEQNTCGTTCPFWNSEKGVACIVMKDSPDTLALKIVRSANIKAGENEDKKGQVASISMKSTGCVKQEVHTYETKLTIDVAGKAVEHTCEINIYFKNKLFDGVSVSLPSVGAQHRDYQRSEWKVLALIAEKITELEGQKS